VDNLGLSLALVVCFALGELTGMWLWNRKTSRDMTQLRQTLRQVRADLDDTNAQLARLVQALEQAVDARLLKR
jgi:hypothetical protein